VHYPYPNRDSNRNADTYANGHPNKYTDQHAGSYRYPHIDADRDSNQYANADTNRHADRDAHGNANAKPNLLFRQWMRTGLFMPYANAAMR